MFNFLAPTTNNLIKGSTIIQTAPAVPFNVLYLLSALNAHNIKILLLVLLLIGTTLPEWQLAALLLRAAVSRVYSISSLLSSVSVTAVSSDQNYYTVSVQSVTK